MPSKQFIDDANDFADWLSHLHVGRDNAVMARELHMNSFGIAARLRRTTVKCTQVYINLLVRHLRQQGIIIGSGKTGYYWPENIGDFKDLNDSTEHAAMERHGAGKRIRRSAQGKNQLTLFEN